jgi:hypothetical protein
MKKPNARVFLEAAESIFMDKQQYACLAIKYDGRTHSKYRKLEMLKFTKLFEPRVYLYQPNWFSDTDKKENQLARQLALLLTAEIVKDEQKRKRK